MHALTIRKDGQAEMFSGSGMTPWHKLGTVVEGLLTAREAIQTAHLDWNVAPFPLFTSVNGQMVACEDNRAIVREDNGKVLAVVGNRYQVLQNLDCFDLFDNVVGSGQAVYDTAGSLFGGKKVWIMAKLKGNLFIESRPDDVSFKYVLLYTSHDGTSSLTMQIVSVRAVCWNTVSLALSSATNKIAIRHTKNATGKQEEAKRALKLCSAYFDNLQGVMNELDKQAMTGNEMIAFTEKLIPDTKEEVSTRTQNIRNEIATLFSRGKGNLGKTRWDALNAVTEYVDHSRATRGNNNDSNESRFASSQFGSGANLKDKAFSLLLA